MNLACIFKEYSGAEARSLNRRLKTPKMRSMAFHACAWQRLNNSSQSNGLEIGNWSRKEE